MVVPGGLAGAGPFPKVHYGVILAAAVLHHLRDDTDWGSVFAYIAREDAPQPVSYLIDQMRRVGFAKVDLLHKNTCFAPFGGHGNPGSGGSGGQGH